MTTPHLLGALLIAVPPLTLLGYVWFVSNDKDLQFATTAALSFVGAVGCFVGGIILLFHT